MFVDGFGACRATQRVDENLVANLFRTKHVGHDVLRDQLLAIRADASAKNDDAVIDADRDVIDVDGVVRLQMLADESAELVVAEVIEVVNVFEVARHEVTCSVPRRDVVARTGTTGRGCKTDCSSRMTLPAPRSPPVDHPAESGSTSLDNRACSSGSSSRHGSANDHPARS